MKLYLLSQEVNMSYGVFDCVVVAAENEEDARKIHPERDGTDDDPWMCSEDMSAWAFSPDQVIVRCIGDAADGVVGGEILCASFKEG